MPRFSLMLARFPGNSSEHPDSSGWMMDLVAKLTHDPRFEIVPFRRSDTPITMTRNQAVRQCLMHKIDYLLMLDSDMKPDPSDPKTGKPLYLGAKPFFDSSFDFLQKLGDKAAVAAPYCGASPWNNIFVFQWANRTNTFRPGEIEEYELAQFTREQAATLGGIQEVGALPTGLILYDCRVFQGMKLPIFYYEYKDDWDTEKASTEDVAQTRDMSLAWYASDGRLGGRVYCNWDAWAHHWKLEEVGKPVLLPASTVGKHFKHVVERKQQDLDEKVIQVGAKRPQLTQVTKGKLHKQATKETPTPEEIAPSTEKEDLTAK
jgi:hypothetical protein